jgi:hypothetical protein
MMLWGINPWNFKIPIILALVRDILSYNYVESRIHNLDKKSIRLIIIKSLDEATYAAKKIDSTMANTIDHKMDIFKDTWLHDDDVSTCKHEDISEIIRKIINIYSQAYIDHAETRMKTTNVEVFSKVLESKRTFNFYSIYLFLPNKFTDYVIRNNNETKYYLNNVMLIIKESIINVMEFLSTKLIVQDNIIGKYMDNKNTILRKLAEYYKETTTLKK